MRYRPQRIGSILGALVFSLALATAVVAADLAAVLGKWTLSMEFQGQPVSITLEIAEDEDGQLTGTWTTPRGTDTLSNVEWSGEELTFTRSVNRQGQELELKHSARIEGDSLEGKLILPQREIPFSGKRSE